MAGITLTSDEEIPALEVRVGSQESSNKRSHVGSDLLLSAVEVENATALTESSADGLIDVEEVGDLVPGVSVGGEAQVIVDLVGTILVEEGDL